MMLFLNHIPSETIFFFPRQTASTISSQTNLNFRGFIVGRAELMPNAKDINKWENACDVVRFSRIIHMMLELKQKILARSGSWRFWDGIELNWAIKQYTAIKKSLRRERETRRMILTPKIVSRFWSFQPWARANGIFIRRAFIFFSVWIFICIGHRLMYAHSFSFLFFGKTMVRPATSEDVWKMNMWDKIGGSNVTRRCVFSNRVQSFEKTARTLKWI